MCETTARAELLLPISSTSPAAAREFVRHSGCPEHANDLLEDALLLITELVTNSVRYGGPPIVLAIECDGEGLHVRVRDGSQDLPRPTEADPEDEGGRGLTLVELLTTTWGVEPVADEYGTGKEVWFALRR